jgi:hypothetical protein
MAAGRAGQIADHGRLPGPPVVPARVAVTRPPRLSQPACRYVSSLKIVRSLRNATEHEAYWFW